MRFVPVSVKGLSPCAPFQGFMVILMEKESKRWLPIFIGKHEAESISILLEDNQHPRPLTYDMFSNIIEATGAELKKVTVTELRDSTFYAEIVIQTAEGKRKIDARPSDAIALALKTKTQIYVSSQVLNEAGLIEDIFAESKPDNLNEKLKKLNEKLTQAVEQEEYETAAKIRDRILDIATNSQPKQ